MSLTLAVLLPFLFAPLVPVLHRYVKLHVGWFVLLVPAVTFAFFAAQLPTLMGGQVIQVAYEWVPSMGLNFNLYLDGWSLLFALLITGIGFLVVLYSIFYLDPEEPRGNFYFYLLAFMGAMLGVVTSNNLILLYVFWELTSFSSFLLIGFWYHRTGSRYGAQKSMLITVLGGLVMLAGFVLLYVITGTFEIRDLIAQAEVIKAHALYLPALICILIGAFSKSAQVPFHIWLPNAMEAPTPVSAYLHSATMVKAGIFLIARIFPIMGGTAEWFWIVSTVGISTMIMGSFLAIRQTDLKAILAFSTVSQLGLIITLYGYGTPAAILAGSFHLLNHSAFKGSLFMMVGIVDHETGTRDVRLLSGLAKKMPITALMAGIGCMAMAGIPPFNGFLSKELFFEASVMATSAATNAFHHPIAILFPIVAVVGSIFTFVYSMMIFHGVFFGPLTDKTDKMPHEAPIGLLAPGLFLAALNVIIGLFPMIVGKTILPPVTESILLAPMQVKIYLWHGFNVPLFMSMAVVVIGALLYLKLETTKKVLNMVPARPSSNAIYDWLVVNVVKGALNLTNRQMTGYLRDYILFTMMAVVGFIGLGVVFNGGYNFNMVGLAPIAVYEALVILIIAAAAIATMMAKSRLMAIISLGIVGYSIALLFVLFRAPDLALTQLIVETVTLALFLLCFYHLPKEIVQETGKATIKIFNIIVAGLTGVLMTVLSISAHNSKTFEPISVYFLENSKTLGGGTNVVNVILVDFRTFDTMGEIVVLGIAAFAVYAMIKLRAKRGKQA